MSLCWLFDPTEFTLNLLHTEFRKVGVVVIYSKRGWRWESNPVGLRVCSLKCPIDANLPPFHRVSVISRYKPLWKSGSGCNTASVTKGADEVASSPQICLYSAVHLSTPLQGLPWQSTRLACISGGPVPGLRSCWLRAGAPTLHNWVCQLVSMVQGLFWLENRQHPLSGHLKNVSHHRASLSETWEKCIFWNTIPKPLLDLLQRTG